MSAAPFDVIIVGGGVSGLAAALAAGDAGARRILVIERHRKPPRVHKGEFLQPATLEILREWGAEAPLEGRGGVHLEMLECRDPGGDRLCAFDYSALAHPFNYGLAQYYSEIRGVLLDRARRVAEIWEGGNVTGLTRGAHGRVDGVTVRSGERTTAIAARLVVAADGPNSTIRRWLGVVADRCDYPHAFLGFDLAGCTMPHRAVAFITAAGARIAYPMPGDRARLYVQVPRDGLASARRRTPGEWSESLLGDCPGLRDVLQPWPVFGTSQAFSAYRALSTQCVLPGVLLIGEAAHTVHPMAGQGMNCSIADSWTLGRTMRAGAAFSDGDDERLDRVLADYAAVRTPQIRRVSHLSHRLARFCTVTSPGGRALVRTLMRRNRGNELLQREATTRIAGLKDEPLGRGQWIRAFAGF